MRSGVGAACPFTLRVLPGFLLELFLDFELEVAVELLPSVLLVATDDRDALLE